MAIVYLNGAFIPEEQAQVSVWDRGFVFGDGVYEVIPVYGGRAFRLGEHLDRLRQSLAGVRIADPLDVAAWTRLFEELIVRNGGGDLAIYLQVTRGVAKRDHAFPVGVTPTVFAAAQPMKPLPASLGADGVTAVTAQDIRWQYCHIKAITLLANVLLRQQAVDAGAAEAILLRDGQATEGAASNVFVVLDGLLVTPPKGPFILPGITRDLVLEIARANGVPCREATITEAELRSAQEVWLTSSTREILPVTQLDGVSVGNGRPGPLWARLIALYQTYKEALRAGTAA